MSKPLTETITVTRPVDPRIADLVHFARYVGECVKSRADGYRDIESCSDADLIKMANSYWDRAHGED